MVKVLVVSTHGTVEKWVLQFYTPLHVYSQNVSRFSLTFIIAITVWNHDNHYSWNSLLSGNRSPVVLGTTGWCTQVTWKLSSSIKTSTRENVVKEAVLKSLYWVLVKPTDPFDRLCRYLNRRFKIEVEVLYVVIFFTLGIL